MRGVAFPVKLWKTIKIAYESGTYSSIEDLHKKLSPSYPQFPACNVIEKRAAAEHWQKAKLAPAIEKKITEETIAAAAKLGITPEKVLKELALIGFADMGDFIDVDEGGAVRSKPLDTLKKDVSRIIKKIREKRVIKQTKDDSEDIILDDTFEFELHDKVACLDKLGKHLGLFSDQNPISIIIPNKIEIETIPTKPKEEF